MEVPSTKGSEKITKGTNCKPQKRKSDSLYCRSKQRKSGAYQTCGKRLSMKKGAKARRLEKLLDQYDLENKEPESIDERIVDEDASTIEENNFKVKDE